MRAAHRPRRTRNAEPAPYLIRGRHGGYHRRQGRLLAGTVLPHEGRMRGRRQASAASSRSRIDGSDRAAARQACRAFRKTTESRNLEDMKLLENRLTGGCLTELRQGSCPGTLSHTRPRGGVVVGRGASRARAAFGRLSAGVGLSGFRGASSETRRTHDEPGRIHRHIQGSNSAEGGRVLSAPLPPIGERPQAPPTAPHTPWGRRRTPSGARPSLFRPTGAPPSWARWAPARPSSPPPPRT